MSMHCARDTADSIDPELFSTVSLDASPVCSSPLTLSTNLPIA
jgi:hypothetical protein